MKNLLNSSICSILIIILLIGCSSESATKSESETKEELTAKGEEPSKDEEKKAIWEIAKVVDEFGDEVKGEGAIIGIFDGKMSNSATTNGDVKVKVQVTKDKGSFITFYEYGRNPGNLPDKKLFKVKIKKENGETEFLEQFSMNNMMTDTKGLLIEKVLSQSSPLKINVDLKRASKYQKTVYNFEINPEGLKELIEK